MAAVTYTEPEKSVAVQRRKTVPHETFKNFQLWLSRQGGNFAKSQPTDATFRTWRRAAELAERSLKVKNHFGNLDKHDGQ